MIARRFLITMCPAVIALVFGGCGSGTHPVTGKVTYSDGEPVQGARVIFRTRHEGEHITAFATSDEQGEYALTTWQTDDGAVVGEHKVIVSKPQQPQQLEDGTVTLLPPEIDERYASYVTTPLNVTVTHGENEINLRVKRYRP